MPINDVNRGDKPNISTCCHKAIQSAKIQRDIEKFEVKGGTIKLFPFGVSFAKHKSYGDKSRETLS